jgi:hypothetical protein
MPGGAMDETLLRAHSLVSAWSGQDPSGAAKAKPCVQGKIAESLARDETMPGFFVPSRRRVSALNA